MPLVDATLAVHTLVVDVRCEGLAEGRAALLVRSIDGHELAGRVVGPAPGGTVRAAVTVPVVPVRVAVVGGGCDGTAQVDGMNEYVSFEHGKPPLIADRPPLIADEAPPGGAIEGLPDAEACLTALAPILDGAPLSDTTAGWLVRCAAAAAEPIDAAAQAGLLHESVLTWPALHDPPRVPRTRALLDLAAAAPGTTAVQTVRELRARSEDSVESPVVTLDDTFFVAVNPCGCDGVPLARLVDGALLISGDDAPSGRVVQTPTAPFIIVCACTGEVQWNDEKTAAAQRHAADALKRAAGR